MLAGVEKAKAAPISRSDLENSFYTWQMSCQKYVRERCECQVNEASAGLPRCRTCPARGLCASTLTCPRARKSQKTLAFVASRPALTGTYDLQAISMAHAIVSAIHKQPNVEQSLL
ncbi:hypothetical protein SAMN05444279_1622 [Ruegeria intermedia]|uniref:Uncharacterized protein n=1 Tax=Ruegeria intermedia TaxID=996115 RepID=A0A1M5BZ33_9RHOB|nr:hypothetical protein SAMN05444279_1622 [Ruegeria intermedia]